jgi:hypothetical protein
MIQNMPQIIMTLGRTQPPHQAHINMLANAFCRLEDGGQLIHFVGSSNAPLSADGPNILSVKEREEILETCVQIELMQRSQQGIRIPKAEIVFKALPDYSDNHATFTPTELATKEADMAAAKTFANEPIYQLGQSYVAWGINVLNVLATCLHKEEKDTSNVYYEVCKKDAHTLAYVDLLIYLSQKYEKKLKFKLVLHIVDTIMLGDKPLSASTIRAEALHLAKQGLTVEQVQNIIQKSPLSSLNYLPKVSLKIFYNKMLALLISPA